MCLECSFFPPPTECFKVDFMLLHNVHGQAGVACQRGQHYHCIDGSDAAPSELELGDRIAAHTNNWHYGKELGHR